MRDNYIDLEQGSGGSMAKKMSVFALLATSMTIFALPYTEIPEMDSFLL